MKEYDVIIIGGGPAGLGAAVYSSRAQLKTVVFEKGLVGGQIVLSDEIENYPGFENPISAFDLTDAMKRQAERFDAEFLTDEVTDISIENGTKIVTTYSGKFQAKAIIYTGGAIPRKLGAPGEKEYTGKGVSYCATCDGALYRGKTVAVIGGGDSAVEEALFLTRFVKKVYIVHRRDKLRANPTVAERAEKNEKIEFVWDSTINEITGSQFVEGMNVHNKKTNEDSVIAIDGIFIYVGILPNNELVKDLVEMNKQGFVITDDEMKSKTEGLWVAGDIRQKMLRQVITATSDGAIAAESVLKWLEEQE